jgi:hypothetical protein
MFDVLANFVSQCLLVVIFWPLGTKEEVEQEIEDTEAVYLETFDNEAELQARIWNQF